MEQYFTQIQTRRLQVNTTRYGYTEVELTESSSIEELMNHRWDWSDFRAFVTGAGGENQMWKILWITRNTLMWAEDATTLMGDDFLNNYAIQRATFTTRSSDRSVLVLAKPRTSALLPANVSLLFWQSLIPI